MRLLEDMGFQAIVLTPMAKVVTLMDFANRLLLINKVSAKESEVSSIPVCTEEQRAHVRKLAEIHAALEA